jgi:HD superfamily phosphohydrolase
MNTAVTFKNDNLYGRIELTPLEQELINTPTFIRLSRIQQLGLVSMVFPGATHTRYIHSLGTLHVMSKITKCLLLEPDERRKLRLAALLHDIGQYPLSHVIEFVYRKIGESLTLPAELITSQEPLGELPSPSWLQRAASRSTLSEEPKDKNMSVEVIKHRPDIQQIFQKHRVRDDEIEDIAKIITGQHDYTLYTHLMDSDYDCDRLDFVQRDAVMTGVKYGFLDLDYLIENLKAVPFPSGSQDKVLAVNKQRALHTLEHYLTARYYMYSQVIYHKTVRALELLAKAIFLQLAQEGEIYRNYKEIIEIIPQDEFLFFDDTFFWQILSQQYHIRNDGNQLKKLIYQLLWKRSEPLSLVKELHNLSGQDGKYDVTRALVSNPSNLDSLCTQANISPDIVIPEELTVDFTPVGSDVPIEELIKNSEEQLRVIRVSPRLWNEDTGETEFLLAHKPSIANRLSGLKLKILRIYLFSDNSQERDQFMRILEARAKS